MGYVSTRLKASNALNSALQKDCTILKAFNTEASFTGCIVIIQCII